MEDDNFILVKLEGRSRKRRKVLRTSISSMQPYNNLCRPEIDVLTLEELQKRISVSKQQIPVGFIGSVIKDIRKALGGRRLTRIRALGLGSFSSHRSSALQLVLLEAIKDLFDISIASSQDPATSVVEQAYLEKRGFDVLPATHCLDQLPDCSSEDEVTLLFMIHCEGYLYNNIISTYWDSSRKVKSFILMGNCCSTMMSETPERALQTLPFVAAFASVCAKPIQIKFESDSYAFSSTSIQFVDHTIKILPGFDDVINKK